MSFINKTRVGPGEYLFAGNRCRLFAGGDSAPPGKRPGIEKINAGRRNVLKGWFDPFGLFFIPERPGFILPATLTTGNVRDIPIPTPPSF